MIVPAYCKHAVLALLLAGIAAASELSSAPVATEASWKTYAAQASSPGATTDPRGREALLPAQIESYVTEGFT